MDYYANKEFINNLENATKNHMMDAVKNAIIGYNGVHI